MALLDQSVDLGGRTTYRLSHTHAAPGWVKSASASDLCGTADLPHEVYADPIKRRLPCHTKAATWMSAAFLADQLAAPATGDDLVGITQRLRKFASYHGIGRDVDTVLGAGVKAARSPDGVDRLDDEDFAVVWKREDGTHERHYPVRNAKEAQAAAEYVVRYRDELPFDIRRSLARHALTKAAQYGASVPERATVERLAGQGTCAAKEAAEAIYSRVRHVARAAGSYTPVQTEMLKLARDIASSPAAFREAHTLEKVARMVDSFDVAHRIHPAQDGLPRVEDVFHAVTPTAVKEASAGLVQTVAGRVYRLSDLEKVSTAEVREVLGDDLADAMGTPGHTLDTEKVASVLPTLPRLDLLDLERVLESRGIRPVIQKEASAADSLYEELSGLKRLAASQL